VIAEGLYCPHCATLDALEKVADSDERGNALYECTSCKKRCRLDREGQPPKRVDRDVSGVIIYDE